MARPQTSPGRLFSTAIVLLCAAVPAVLCHLFAKPPRERAIHIESFRYGKDPSVIRVNRGDTLRLTFSTRDTGHSFFLEEFDVDAKVAPLSKDVNLFRATDPEAGFTRVREVVITADPPGAFGFLFSRYQFRCHVWCGPMHAFEHGTLVIGPNTLLFAALGALVGILLVGLLRVRASGDGPPPPTRTGWDILRRFPRLSRVVRWRGFQFWVALPALIFLQIVILTSILGTQMAGRNLGVMLLWVVWLFLLTTVLTPLGGRIWCLACPLPLPGEMLQRGTITGVRCPPSGSVAGGDQGTNNLYRGAGLRWPSALSGAWPRTLFFLVLGTFSVALVAEPAVTGWVLLGLMLCAAILSLVFRHRAFCRYVCPINAFVGLYGRTGKLALRKREAQVCADCVPKSCLRGGVRGWACPYGLCVEEIEDNAECGLCSECLKTCPHDNIGVFVRPFAEERKVVSAGEAFLAMVMLGVGLAYCAVYLGPWPALRDMVNILDKGNWSGFALYAAMLWFVTLALIPAVLFGVAWAGKRLSGTTREARRLFLRSTGALLPIGLCTWIAFSIPMLMVNKTFVLQSLSDPLGRGWDLFGMAGEPWRQLWPQVIPWLQAVTVLFGFGYSLRNGYRICREEVGEGHRALRCYLPLALALTALAAGLISFFTN